MSAAFSHVIQLGQIGAGLTRRLEPDEDQRRAIARDLEVEALHAFVAELEVVPWSDGAELRGRLTARMTRLCGVTLEPLEEAVDERFSVRIVPADSPLAEASPAHDLPLDAEDPPDVSEDGRVDLAAYAVEHLGLAMDPFPRKPDAVFEPPAEPVDLSPFAVLRRLKDAPET